MKKKKSDTPPQILFFPSYPIWTKNQVNQHLVFFIHSIYIVEH
jgi:hypothetical protein